MSRSSYSEDYETWDWIRWRGAVASAIRGKRGQLFLKEMVAAMDQLKEKRLIADTLCKRGEFCAIGTVGAARQMEMKVDDFDRERIAQMFGISPALAAEIMFMNDEAVLSETPEQRFTRVRAWADQQLIPEPTET